MRDFEQGLRSTRMLLLEREITKSGYVKEERAVVPSAEKPWQEDGRSRKEQPHSREFPE